MDNSHPSSHALSCVILAAGKGTRMRSGLPKVMHRLGDVPLVSYPVQLAQGAGADPVVVVTGHGHHLVEDYLTDRFEGLRFVRQEEQLGTAHAVAQAGPVLRNFPGRILILYGDVPLVPRKVITELIDAMDNSAAPLALATTFHDHPPAYGRIIRNDQGQVLSIREDRDCTPQERAITELNPGLYLVQAEFLFSALDRVDQQNAQGEFYLTDLVALASRRGTVPSVSVEFDDVLGVNDRADLARVEQRRLRGQRNSLMRSGVTMRDPSTVWLGHEVTLGGDTEIWPHVVLRGKTTVGQGCIVGPGTVLEDCTVGDNCVIGAHCLLQGQQLALGSTVAAGTRALA
jgi:bifunctional UDP-N-acetylglucosamine pyrophosphorylase/glucosamine-1-phosphate N-acetyltransferase